ncbi:MAG: 30S ribosomal protein S8 [Chloroflexi bacterium GWB2_49_20]|nr:MAG: 30S ribosomal protein S8 [Chloroflexi bacterium GWB2_49_20]OGN76654.1 MAG: 30S ribosomal protein S8 [Chloroflexi bacterium GWC2_49_37]OGN83614.1 MAG: 30S ribosomal protein S8 [Chloroflexi bacterium GWD2_49_16]HBG74267.1 30S ribosomal protein S8 [Anaerolineae bacterium]HCC79472.1 30S ribosomal protein S8 [Anaerolineae bacterium]
MSFSDPIADMLTRIRNAVMSGQSLTAMPHSKVKAEIAKILKEEGYIDAYDVVDGERPGQLVLRIRIKYIGERRERHAVITNLERISRPGRRVYTKKQDIPWVLSGLGVAILSTPKGIMTGQHARQMNLGGELLCKVW